MSNHALTRQDGVLVADLDQDGRKEVIFAQETRAGQASIVALRPDGSLKWRHIFSDLAGSVPYGTRGDFSPI